MEISYRVEVYIKFFNLLVRLKLMNPDEWADVRQWEVDHFIGRMEDYGTQKEN